MIFLLRLTAQNGTDYDGFFATLTFPARSSNGNSQCIDVQILDDNIFEEDEYFIISLILFPMPPGVTVQRSNVTITIEDNDRKYALA